MRLGYRANSSEQPTIPEATLLHICRFYFALEQLGPSTPLAVSRLDHISSSFPRNSSFRTRVVANTDDLRAAAAKEVQTRLRPSTEQIIPNRRVVRREPHVPVFREDFATSQNFTAELAEHHMQRCEEARDDVDADPS